MLFTRSGFLRWPITIIPWPVLAGYCVQFSNIFRGRHKFSKSKSQINQVITWLILQCAHFVKTKPNEKVWKFCWLVRFLSFFSVIDSLSNLSVRIPEYIQKGQTADLTCSFNLGGDKLYSVKWYKGRHEFYRYMPGQDPVIKTFPVKGMEINVSFDYSWFWLNFIFWKHSQNIYFYSMWW